MRYIFFSPQKINAKHASTWRIKHRPKSRSPTDNELEYVIRKFPAFRDLPDEWACACCNRSKREVVRWSQNSSQFTFVLVTRNILDASASYGKRKVKLCDACNHVFQECHKELRALLGDQVVPDCPVGLDEIRAIIVPKAHSLHNVNAEAAEGLVRSLISALQETD